LSEQRKYRSWTAQQKLEIVLAGLRGDRPARGLPRARDLGDALLHVAGEAVRARRPVEHMDPDGECRKASTTGTYLQPAAIRASMRMSARAGRRRRICSNMQGSSRVGMSAGGAHAMMERRPGRVNHTQRGLPRTPSSSVPLGPAPPSVGRAPPRSPRCPGPRPSPGLLDEAVRVARGLPAVCRWARPGTLSGRAARSVQPVDGR
jgi:hypothetical protein